MNNQKQKIPKPARYVRSCGHPNDWTLDLKRIDNIVESYCLGCIIQKLGLRPVDKFKIKIGKDNKVEIIRVKE